MQPSLLDQQIAAVRRFNRFYTRQIGVLAEGYLQSPFSLAEARVLYELAQGEPTTATELGGALGLDAGYLSRIIGGFAKAGLIVKQPSPSDGRQSLLRLTEAGRAAFTQLDERSRADFAQVLAKLTADERRRLVGALGLVERLLGDAPARPATYMLREHRPGDMGWVIGRHGALYAEEYGWDGSFEALVATIAAEFITRFDPRRERCWIAEIDGEPVGSVFLVRKTDTVAKLRMLLVEPRARGMGIGARLVAECVRFARQCGYTTLTLWTNSILGAARHLYVKAGFQLVESEPHHSFGHDLVGETWELALDTV